jgi:hypothetical protein
MHSNRLLFAAAIAIAGCSSSDALTPDVDDDRTLVGTLQTPAELQVDGPASLVAVRVESRTPNEETRTSAVDFTVTRGQLGVRADRDGNLVVNAVEFDLEDIQISPEMLPPDGLMLRELHVRLDYPASAPFEWRSDNTASGEVSLHVTVDWSAEFGEQRKVYPLRSIEFEDLRVHGDLAFQDGHVVVHASAAQDGTFWEWAQMFELTDLVLELDARSE